MATRRAAVKGEMKATATDRTLVEASRRGDRAAAGELFERHWELAWRAAYAICGQRAAAADAAQEAFIRAFGALDSFEPGRPFAPWLHRIVVNQAIDALRRDRRAVPVAQPESSAASADGFAAADLRLDVVAALAQVQAERRVVLVLRHLIGYSPAEIAAIVDAPVGTVASRLARGLEDLRTFLEVCDAGRR
jgi:RNA polymerase sigma-70 factor, ECF subfamily